MINIPKPDKALLKALADAGALPKDEVPASKTRRSARRSRSHSRMPPIRVPAEEPDPFWPAIVVILACLAIFCLFA